jgi:hypothetical protein
MRRTALALVGLAGLFTLFPQIAAAQIYPYSYPWCAKLLLSGSQNCGFVSFDQCQAFALGTGAYCASNPWYRGPVAADQGGPRKRKHRS